MKYIKNYCEEKGISTSELNESQRTLYYIAENMKMDKSISEEGYRHFQMAIKALEQRWIPVSERLPKKSEYGKVLVTYIPSGGTLWTTVIIAHYSDLMGIAKPSFHIGEVGKESFQNITKQVIAWMPLPEPYKAEREEKR